VGYLVSFAGSVLGIPRWQWEMVVGCLEGVPTNSEAHGMFQTDASIKLSP